MRNKMNRCCCDVATVAVRYTGWRWSRQVRIAEPFVPYPFPDAVPARWSEFGQAGTGRPSVFVWGTTYPGPIFPGGYVHREAFTIYGVITNGKPFTQFKFTHATTACTLQAESSERDMHQFMRCRIQGVLTPSYIPPAISATITPATNVALSLTNAFVDLEGKKSDAIANPPDVFTGYSLPITEIDLTDIANEVISSPGWVSGNSICFITRDNGSDVFTQSSLPSLETGLNVTLTIEHSE